MAQPLSTDLDDPEARALRIARVMREALCQDVWRFVALADVLALWSRIEKHLGRTRAFWQWLLQGWRDDGLIPRAE